jgi:CheY-like chemotaxis protein
MLMAPVSLLRLNALFGTAISIPLEPPVAVPAIAARRNVLLVEDNDVNALIATTVLQRGGGSVVRAASGEEALAAFGAGAFDLVLMDLQMPGMDGYEATRRIRAWERAQNRRMAVPIVALTANAMASDAAACLACGMNDYLTKPVRAEQLLQLLSTTPASVAETEAHRAKAVEPTEAMLAKPGLRLSAFAVLPIVADGSPSPNTVNA